MISATLYNKLTIITEFLFKLNYELFELFFKLKLIEIADRDINIICFKNLPILSLILSIFNS